MTFLYTSCLDLSVQIIFDLQNTALAKDCRKIIKCFDINNLDFACEFPDSTKLLSPLLF